MAGRPKKTSGEGKETLEVARCLEPGTSQVALGQNREGICLQRTGWPRNPGGTFQRQEPAHCLSFHVRTGLGRWLPALLVLGRPLRQHAFSPRTARYGLCRRFPRKPEGN